MSGPREVRVDPRFFEQLDAQLGEDRGPRGEASRTDFLLIDLPPISEEFALHFEELPEPIPGRSDYRIVITTGHLAARLSVIGQLQSDSVVVLIGLDIDLEAGW